VKTFIKITLVLALGLCANSVLAFHDGGVAQCSGCHTMHNSQNGALVDTAHPNGNAYLLNAGNPSDTCLRCHASYGQFASGTGMGAGGDFYWVTRNFTWGTGTSGSRGDSHGHNIIAPTKGLTVDATLAQAPGGSFLSARLGCTSCHDPHGNQNFRILYGAGAGPKYDGTRYAFTANAPIAKGNSRKTTSGMGVETNSAHTVYKSGMSEWCANCHTNFHELNTGNFVHPTRALGSEIAASYNAYVSTDDALGGNVLTSYNGLVPFEMVNVDLATVNSENFTQGPSGVDKVMCVTCHRAHASPFSDAARWDMSVAFLSLSHPNSGDNTPVQTDIDRKYYQYTFSANQRSLCNKCHVKDYGDEPYTP
jgi:hypothetical protein